MAINNLLVVFNDAKVADSALRAALLMQAKYDAHLTGLLVHFSNRDRAQSDYWLPSNVKSAARTAVRDREDAMEQRFRTACAGRVPPQKTHWISMSGSPDETIARYAVMYDMTIAGQQSRSTDAAVDVHPERIALKSARPVLVMPAEFDAGAIDRRAVIAWDGRRAASRVIRDAMDVLQTKAEVDVVSFGDRVYRPAKSIDVVTALSRHGIEARRVRLPRPHGNPGPALLDYCDSVNAGMVISGVYERGVLREELFGGMARHILHHARIPVLVSC